MKAWKRFGSLCLAVLMALALAVPGLAALESKGHIDLGKNAITVTNVKAGATYKLYKMLDLESYDLDAGAYSYKVNAAWIDFFKAAEGENPAGAGNAYVTINEQGYVTWKEGADVAAFGKAADAYASEHSLEPLNTATVLGFEKSVIFGNLDSGYYLITSTVGTRVIVETTPDKKDVVVSEKNEVPSVDKTVQEDSTEAWGKTNDADIGQVVNFKSTITAQPGAENYVFYDQMTAGLTYKNDAKVYTDEAMTTELTSSNYTVSNTATDTYTFKITFTQGYLDTITAETKLYVKYSATVNENAVVGLNGNANDSWLDYGDKNNTKSTPKSETTTYTWDLDVLKYANGDKSKVLEGVKFVLLNSDKTKVATVANGKLTGWETVPTAGEDGKITWPTAAILTTDANGKIEIDGLDADTYYLREIEALPGFNILGEDKQVTIGGVTTGEDGQPAHTDVVVEINNQSGTELPSTGGMGTTLFYVIGGILVVGAGVVLVSKKRME